MSSLNKVCLIGNLGQDPEERKLNNGDPVVNFSLATSEKWKDRSSGEARERTEWHKIVVFGEALCKVAASYLRKGSKVYLEGQLQTRKWTDQSGNDHYSTEVVLRGFGGKIVLLGDPREGPGPGDAAQQQPHGGRGTDFDDDVPF